MASDSHPPALKTPPPTSKVSTQPDIAIPERRRPLWPILLGLGVIGGCALVLLVAALVVLLQATPPIAVTVMVSGTADQVQTSAHTVGDVLRQLGITLGDGDTVSPPPDSTLTPDMVVNVQHTRAVTITVDGVPQTIQTLFTNPLDILNSIGLTPGAKDRIVVDGTETKFADLLVWPVPVTLITIQHAVTVHIDDDGHKSAIQTTRPTVGEALFEANVTLYLADSVTPDINDPITPDMTISIHRSQPVTVIADGVSLETRTRGTTVADALVSANVPLMGLDYSIPDENSLLQPGMTIRVMRVTEQVNTQQDVIPFQTTYQADADLELDQLVTLQEGQNGIQKTSVRVRYENGVQVSQQTEDSTVALNPVDRIIGYGTKVVIRSVDTPDGPRDYWRKIRMYATSYHPAALGGDDTTATGQKLTKGIVGIDPKLIPYGTQLYVDGYGVGVAADTGGPRRIKLWIDLGYDDSNWISWSKYVDVYLLTPVPAQIQYILPQ